MTRTALHYAQPTHTLPTGGVSNPTGVICPSAKLARDRAVSPEHPPMELGPVVSRRLRLLCSLPGWVWLFRDRLAASRRGKNTNPLQNSDNLLRAGIETGAVRADDAARLQVLFDPGPRHARDSRLSGAQCGASEHPLSVRHAP